jgi:hypothetical protein
MFSFVGAVGFGLLGAGVLLLAIDIVVGLRLLLFKNASLAARVC